MNVASGKKVFMKLQRKLGISRTRFFCLSINTCSYFLAGWVFIVINVTGSE